ncbi:MAG: hypothetical protein JO320_15045 [Alphaproteobacteria bacterium]|nr:hypothetical protein [Alphaproteobacteria bacterium]MBV9376352.1 hypothetical protein [Alphaproteobacteria bacterium]
MKRLLTYGLSVEVDPRFVPTQAESGAAKFCFDPNVGPRPIPKPYALPVESTAAMNAFCKPALVPKAAQASQPQTMSGSIQEADTKESASGRKKLTLDAKVTLDKPNDSTPLFSFPDPVQPDVDVYVYTRSVYGAYRFLGQLLSLYEENTSEWPLDPLFWPDPKEPGLRMLNVTHSGLGCWAKIEYKNEPWCVPTEAYATKRSFQIMHQLFRLFATPSTQPVTQTVRTVPGA